MRLAVDLHPVRQLIVVGVAVVEKAALLDSSRRVLTLGP